MGKASVKKVLFIRWGGLSSTVQKGYNPKMPTMHCPPARRGLYAFPWPQIERFLLGASTFQQHRMIWLRDEDGNRIQYGHPDYKKYGESNWAWSMRCPKEKAKEDALPEDSRPDPKWYLCKHVRPKKFKYEGELWHHLHDIPRCHVLEEKGWWIKSKFPDYKVALYKEIGRIKRQWYSKDHLEVFIEKV